MSDCEIGRDKATVMGEILKETLDLESEEKCVWEWNVSTGKVIFSESCFELLGYSQSESKGCVPCWRDFVHKDERKRVYTTKSLIENSSENYECVYRMKKKAGTYSWILARGSAIEKDRSGRIVKIAGTHTAINDLVKTRTQLKERVKELELFYDFSRLVIESENSPEKLFSELVTAIPKAFADPANTKAVIEHRDRVYRCELHEDVSEYASGIEEPINSGQGTTGRVRVFYRGKDGVDFLSQERRLLASVGKMLGKVIQRIESFDKLQESKKLFEVTLSSVGDAVIATDKFGTITFANPVACELIGLEKFALVGKDFTETVELFSDKTGERVELPLNRVLETGEKLKFQGYVNLRAKDGSLYVISDSLAPIVRPTREPIGVVFSFKDVTDQRQRERLLEESEERYKNLVDNMIGGLAILDSEDGLTFRVKDIKSSINGFPFEKKDIIGKDLRDVFPAIESSKLYRVVKEVWLKGEGRYAEPEYYDGKRLQLWWENYVYRLPSGEVAVLNYDVTERKRLEVFKRTSYEKLIELSKLLSRENFELPRFINQVLRSVLETLKVDHVGVYTLKNDSELEVNTWHEIGPDGRVRDVPRRDGNEPFKDFLRYIQSEKLFDVSDMKFAVSDMPLIQKLKNNNISNALSIALRKRDKLTGLFFCDSIEPRNWTDEEKYFFTSVADTLTIALEEDSLMKSEERHRNLFQMSGAVMLHVEPRSGKIFDANPAACEFYGYSREELKELSLRDISEKGASLLYLRDSNKEKVSKFSARHTLKDGQIKNVELFVSPFETNEMKLVNCIVFDVTESLAARRQLHETMLKLEESFEDTIQLVGKIVELRDPYTAGHQERVSALACEIAKRLNFGPERLNLIRTTSLLHDIGKISIPAEILTKPGKLTATEWELIKNHPVIGQDILKGVRFAGPVVDIIRQHHERLDGSGYPDGLRGEEIMLEARIIAVADVVEAMISHRPYRASPGMESALAEVRSNSGKLYDPLVVSACVEALESGFEIKTVYNA